MDSGKQRKVRRIHDGPRGQHNNPHNGQGSRPHPRNKVKTTCTIDGNTLIQDQKGTFDSVLKRELKDGKMVMVLTVQDVVCTRVYKPTE
ncbi:acid-binding, muscle isoform X2 [Octopus vulgaris]|uniref:Acid-binding, muscle isoform X2 n=1 Tax=Octopus vulgaris TaxID=6645 RepID=A0AA36C0X1_OCTVU|nr:acid-binding, muscle isoform X2 [Octopus vulgaris]